MKRTMSYLRSRARRGWWIIPSMVIIAFLPGLVSPTGRAQAQRPGSLRGVTLRLSWTVIGLHAPFFLAAEKGFYAAEGLDVKILEGRGSIPTIQLVANKSDTFGIPDITSSAIAISQGAPVKVVAVVLQKNPMVITYLGQAGLSTPQALVGKRIAATPGENLALIFPAYLRLNGVDPAKVTMVGMDGATKPRAVLQGSVDGQLDYLNAAYPAIKVKNATAQVQKFSDFGMETFLTQSILAHTDLIKSEPDVIRRFLAGTVKGWEAARTNPVEAAAALKKAHPETDEGVVLEQVNSTITLLQTNRSMGHVLGWSAEEDWQATLDLGRKYGGFTGSSDVKLYYTNEFLPKR